MAVPSKNKILTSNRSHSLHLSKKEKISKTISLAFASSVGTALEWYDFMIYNTMAALVFNRLFFSNSSPMAGTIMAFSTYAVGYMSRPLGGVFFGRLGDKIGRRSVLILTLVLMGLSTTAIGLLPTYETIGIASPIALVMLRFIQGVALGGEWAGAVLLSVEHGSNDRRGQNASWAQMGPGLGTILSSLVIGTMTLVMNNHQFIEWGWRIPFALSGVLVILGLFFRRSIPETPQFEEMKAGGAIVRSPLRELMKNHMRGLLIASSTRIGPDVLYALLTVFSITYVTEICGLSRSVILTALLIGAVCNVFIIVFYGFLSDYVGSRQIFLFGILSGIPAAFVFFYLVNTRETALIVLAVSAGLMIHAAGYSVQGTLITRQFPPNLRYTGASMAYTFGSLAGGGAFAPLIMATLFKETSSVTFISMYVAISLIVSGIGILFSKSSSVEQCK